MSYSLRHRLSFILLGLTLLAWFVTVVVAALYARQLTMRQIDQHLTVYSAMAQHTQQAILADPNVQNYFEARSVRIASDSELRRVKSFIDADRGNAVNLWFGGSQVLVGEAAPAFPPPVEEGFVTAELGDGTRWRIRYRHSPEFNVWQAVGIDMASAMRGGFVTFGLWAVPLFIILPVTLAILFFGIRNGLRPLNDLAEQISARNPHVVEPFETEDVPQEIKPIVVSLNGLLGRLQRALASEHRFTDNAAHELQTPLAAIQAAVQSCQRQIAHVPDSGELRHMLERISSRVSSATGTVKQLLTLARLDTEKQFQREPVELAQLMLEVMADVGGLAMDRQISVNFNDSSQAWVSGNADWLAILLRNLFVNAVKYSPSPGEIDVVLEYGADYVSLSIANDCEPIPEEEFQHLAERFYQPANGSNQGVGLGLSIAQRIAELHRGELCLRRRGASGGFIAEVHFPRQWA